MAQISNISAKLTLNTKNFTSGLMRAKKRADKFTNSIAKSALHMAKWGAAGAAAAGGLAALGAAAWGTKLALQAEQSQVAFGVLLGSADKAKTMLANLNKFAAQTPFAMPGLRQAAQTMLNFGIKGKDVMANLDLLSNVASGDNNKLQSLALVFGQISSNGHLMGQNLLQLINVGFNPLLNISKRTGESMTELRKRMSKGKVSFAEVRQAFIDATSAGGRFYHMNEKQSKTLLGRLSTISDMVGQTLKGVMQGLFESINLKKITSDLGEVLPVIKDITMTVMHLAIDTIGSLLKNLGLVSDESSKGGNIILSAMEAGAKAIAYIADAFDAARWAGNKLRQGILKLYSWEATGIAKILSLAAKLPDWLGGGLANTAAQGAKLFAANLDQEIAKIQDTINKRLLQPSNVEAVTTYFNNVRKQMADARKKAAEDAEKNNKPLNILPKPTGGSLFGGLFNGLGKSIAGVAKHMAHDVGRVVDEIGRRIANYKPPQVKLNGRADLVLAGSARSQMLQFSRAKPNDIQTRQLKTQQGMAKSLQAIAKNTTPATVPGLIDI